MLLSSVMFPKRPCTLHLGSIHSSCMVPFTDWRKGHSPRRTVNTSHTGKKFVWGRFCLWLILVITPWICQRGDACYVPDLVLIFMLSLHLQRIPQDRFWHYCFHFWGWRNNRVEWSYWHSWSSQHRTWHLPASSIAHQCWENFMTKTPEMPKAQPFSYQVVSISQKRHSTWDSHNKYYPYIMRSGEMMWIFNF